MYMLFVFVLERTAEEYTQFVYMEMFLLAKPEEYCVAMRI